LFTRFTKELLKRINTPETVTAPWGFPLAIALVVMYLIIFFLCLLFISTLSDTALESPEPRILAYTALMSALLMLVLAVQYTENAIAKARADKKKIPSYSEVLALVPSKNTPLWGILLSAFAIATATDVIGFMVGVPENSLPMPLDGLSRNDRLPFLAAVLAVMLVRPITEELIFRGGLYTASIKQLAHVQAVLLSAGLFTVLHFMLDTDIWWGLVYPLVLGLTASIVRAMTQSTQMAIGTHLMFALFVVLRALII
jgi:membrane protease YdiL (CAAX protease family)